MKKIKFNKVNQLKSLEGYLRKIMVGSRTLRQDQLEFLLDGLYHIATSMENRSFDSIKKKNLAFSREFSRRIRENQKISQEKLSIIIGFGKDAQGQISSIENGVTKPQYPITSEFIYNYMNWLKEQGYNPFEL